MHKILVQGHRGSRGTHPENTLAGFKAAILAGCDFLELDLQGTKDRQIVIFHDFLEKKYASPISLLTLQQLKTIDCGIQTNPRFPSQEKIAGEKIPTLEELFECISSLDHPNAKKIRLNLEMKRDPKHPEWSLDIDSFASLILSKVRKYHFENRVYYSSFDPELLKKIREQDEKAKLGLIFDETSLKYAQILSLEEAVAKILELAKALKISILSPSFPFLKETKTASIFQQAGFQLMPWTVNDPKSWEECIAWKVDGIITDYPQDLIGFLRSHKI